MEIEVRNLTKYFADIPAVVDVNFGVTKGEILGFLGPNGAGKTTTMRVINGFLPPTEGSVTVSGFDVMEDSLEVRRRIGYLPENPAFYDEMTAKGYLSFASKIHGVPRTERKERIDEAMEKTQITDVANRLVGHLSKGYRQRLGLAQALIHDPPVLILDEPTTGLDPRQIIETRELIRSLKGDHTVILSTHILPEASQVCDEIVIISKGRVIAEDTPDHLHERLRGSQQINLKVRGPQQDVKSKLEGLPGVLVVETASATDGAAANGAIAELMVEGAPDEDVREKLARCVVEGGWGLLEMASKQLSLEDIYLQLTTEEEDVQ